MKKNLLLRGIEPGIFRLVVDRLHHWTTETIDFWRKIWRYMYVLFGKSGLPCYHKPILLSVVKSVNVIILAIRILLYH